MKFKFLFYVLGLLFLNISFAGNSYELDTDLSALSFVTIKKNYTVEPASIKSITGTISNEGEFSISIPVNAIDTGVSIRNKRLADIFFEEKKYPTFNATGSIDLEAIDEVQSLLEELRESWAEAVKQTGGIKRKGRI